MAGITYSDPKYRNIVTGTAYKEAQAELDSLRLNQMTSADAIGIWQANNPQLPLYQDSTGKYTLEPTENHPQAIVDFWKQATSTDEDAEKYVIAWPYANGQLSEAGYEKFKSEVKVNKVVALSGSTPGVTDSVRHDIVQLDSDIRDYRIRANFLSANQKELAKKYIITDTDGNKKWADGTPETQKTYLKDIVHDLVIVNASITGIGGAERQRRKLSGDNSTYDTYNKKLNLVANEFGEQLEPINIGPDEMAGDIPVAGQVVAIIEGGVDSDSETGEDADLIILSNTVNGDGSVYNGDTGEFEGPDHDETEKVPTKAGNPNFRGKHGFNKDKSQKTTDQEVSPVNNPEMAKWAQYPAGTPKPNVLHYFSSWATQFELFMLNPSDFNEIQDTLVTTGFSEAKYFDFTKKPERLLMSTSGNKNKQTHSSSSNNRFFTRDYHLDNVNIESYISPSVANGGAKFTNVTCTVFEPFGATLIENLVKACVSKPINGESYLEMPYMLKVKFFGYNDKGEIIDTRYTPVGAEGNSDQVRQDVGTKYLVLKIGNINFKVTPEGTEYEFEFYNYNAFAFENYSGVLESNIQVNSGTLGKFFGLTNVGEGKGITEFTTTKHSLKGGDNPVYTNGEAQEFYMDKITRDSGITEYELVNKGTTAKNLPEILNSIQAKKKEVDDKGKTAQDTADTFSFKLDAGKLGADKVDSFFNHKIVKPESYDINNIPVYNQKVYATYAQSQKFNKYIPIEGTDSAFQLYAGQSIIDVIRAVIQTSTFMTSQVQSTSKIVQKGPGRAFENDDRYQEETITYSFQNTPEKPLILYKVNPLVKFGAWDAKRNTYQKDITYIISLYTAEGEIQEAMGKYGVTDCVKQYDYLYTGQNKDVLEFDLQFKAGAFELNEIGEFAKFGMQDLVSSTHEVADAGTPNSGVNSFAIPIKNQKLDQKKGTQGNTSDFPTMIARNLMSRIYHRGADKLVGELQIVGDPQWITQDEGFGLQAHASHFSQNGSVNTHSDPIVLLNFLTPVDIEGNENSPNAGTMRWNDPSGSTGNTTSVFSGFYKVLTISTNISGNEFTQNLTMARIQQQEYDAPDVFKGGLTEAITTVPGQSTFVVDHSVKKDSQKSSSTGYRDNGGFPY